MQSGNGTTLSKGSRRCVRGATIIRVLLSVQCVVIAGEKAHASNSYSVRIEGCPTLLQLHVPEEFSRAAGPAQLKRRDDILNRLHSNPGRKARHAEVLLADWNTTTGFPQISIASLGTLIQKQGSITEKDWNRLKSELLHSSMRQRQQWMNAHLQKLEPHSKPEVEKLRGRINDVSTGASNSITAFATSSAVIHGQPVKYESAATVIYSRRCVAYVVTAVDAEEPDALDRLLAIVAKIRVD